MQNKKIIGATTCTYGDISFKSILEKNIYSYLKNKGFDPKYEYKKFILFKSFIPVTPFYNRETKAQYNKRTKNLIKKGNRNIVLCNKTILPITYTPDIYIKYKDIDIWIECKGFENDSFPIKKKMFIKLLDDIESSTGQKSMYFEIYSVKQAEEMINIINKIQ